MGKYRKKSEFIEAITFQDFVEYAKETTDPPHWAINWQGLNISHENDEMYLVPIPGKEIVQFTPSYVLVKNNKGKVYLTLKEIFDDIYEEVEPTQEWFESFNRALIDEHSFKMYDEDKVIDEYLDGESNLSPEDAAADWAANNPPEQENKFDKIAEGMAKIIAPALQLVKEIKELKQMDRESKFPSGGIVSDNGKEELLVSKGLDTRKEWQERLGEIVEIKYHSKNPEDVILEHWTGEVWVFDGDYKDEKTAWENCTHGNGPVRTVNKFGKVLTEGVDLKAVLECRKENDKLVQGDWITDRMMKKD